MKKLIAILLMLVPAITFAQEIVFDTITFVKGGSVFKLILFTDSLQINNTMYYSFKGLGADTSLWKLNGTSIYNKNGGGVGIGTIPAAYHKFHVLGTTRIESGSTALFVGSTAGSGGYAISASISGAGGTGILGHASATSPSSYGVDGYGYYGVRGQGFIGVTGVSSGNYSTASAGNFVNTGLYGTGIKVTTGGGHSGIFMGGNVGVNTTTPSETVEVNGCLKTNTLKVGPYSVSVTDNVSIPQTFAMTYPASGIAVSTGSAWGSSITDNSTNWTRAYDRFVDSENGFRTTELFGIGGDPDVGKSLTVWGESRLYGDCVVDNGSLTTLQIGGVAADQDHEISFYSDNSKTHSIIANNNENGAFIYSANGHFWNSHSNSRLMTLDYAGNLGIGTTTPEEKFSLIGTSSFSDNMKLATTKKLYLDGGTDDYLYQPTPDIVDFVTAGIQRFRIRNGVAGIGLMISDDTTSVGVAPAYPLYINNNLGSGNGSIGIDAFGGTVGSVTFIQRTSGGTRTAPTATPDGATMVGVTTRGHNGTSFEAGGKGTIGLKAHGLHSASNNGTYAFISLTANGSTSNATERFRFSTTGLSILTAAHATEALDINGNIKLSGVQKILKVSTTPTIAASETSIYTKGNYYVIAYNDAGTMKYRYFDQTATANPPVWVYSTTAP